jgi:hypothetical protein
MLIAKVAKDDPIANPGASQRLDVEKAQIVAMNHLVVYGRIDATGLNPGIVGFLLRAKTASSQKQRQKEEKKARQSHAPKYIAMAGFQSDK